MIYCLLHLMVQIGVKSNNITEVPLNSKELVSDEKTLIPIAKAKNFQDVKWNDPKSATNISKDAKIKLREKAERLLNSELFTLMPKILSVFGVWFTLTPIMKIGEKGLSTTVKSIVPPAVIAGLALGFDYRSSDMDLNNSSNGQQQRQGQQQRE